MDYTSYWEYLTTQVKHDIGVDPTADHYNEIITDGQFTIGTSKGHKNAKITALVVEPMDPDVREERKKLDAKIEEAKENDNRERLVELVNEYPDPEPPYEERSQWATYELPDDLSEEAAAEIHNVRNNQTIPNAHIEDVSITGYKKDGTATLSASGRVIRKDNPTGALEAAARAVAADHDRIPSASAVNSMRVSVGPTDPDRDPEEDEIGGLSPHDYTIYFETPKPHEFWAEPDTFEEYKERTVENSDDLTMEDVEDKDTMPVHVHMQTGEHADLVIEAISRRRIQDAVKTDEFELAPTQFYLNDEQETVYGSITNRDL